MHIYYVSFLGVGAQIQVSWGLYSRSHHAESRLGLLSHSVAYGCPLPGSFRLLLEFSSCGCRTEALFSCWLLARGRHHLVQYNLIRGVTIPSFSQFPLHTQLEGIIPGVYTSGQECLGGHQNSIHHSPEICIFHRSPTPMFLCFS